MVHSRVLGVARTHECVPDFDGASAFEDVDPDRAPGCMVSSAEDMSCGWKAYSDKLWVSSPNSSSSVSGSVSVSNSIWRSLTI